SRHRPVFRNLRRRRPEARRNASGASLGRRDGSQENNPVLAGRKWLRKAALLLAVCAGGVGASTAPSVVPQWTADPDEQFLLDVNIRQLRLGDGVRAYNTPEGTCVVFGDFLTTLDLPMKIDLGTKRASGWAFREDNKIDIDQA